MAARAKAVFAVGTCSCYGGIQAAHPNPTGCSGISEVITQKVVQVPGCPPSDINVVANFAFYALFQTLPHLDEKIVLNGLMASAYMICAKERSNLKVGYLLSILMMS